MIRILLRLYIVLIVLDFILSFFPKLHNEVWVKKVREWAEFTLAPVRNNVKVNLPVDISPMIVIALIELFIFLW